MKRKQYEKLRYDPRGAWDPATRAFKKFDYKTSTHIETPADPPKFIVMTGKHKGKIVEFNYCYTTTLAVSDEKTNEFLHIHYTALEHVDENGNPVYEAIVDMTGRTIEAGKFIVYSVSAGNSSHALEIGKIEEITKTGGLKVSRNIRNGEKISSSAFYSASRTINDPDRALVLPVEVSTLMSWVLTEFEDLKNT